MSSKDLGALVVRLEADVSKLKTAITETEKIGTTAQDAGTKVKGLADRFSDLKTVLPGAVAGFLSLRTAMRMDTQFTKQITIQEEATARLTSALIATGHVAGQTIENLDKMAMSLQKTTTRTMSEISTVQSIVAAFTNIRGDQFAETTKTVINLADALKLDLAQSTRSVGKALQDPIKGMLSLQRLGLKLTPILAEQVQQFMSVNDIVGAQDIILKHLNFRLAYTSEMMARTLPGALKQTKNAWDNLFRISGTDGVELYRKSILNLRDSLETKEMKVFVQMLGSMIFTIKAVGTEILTLALNFKELIVAATIVSIIASLTVAIKLLIPAFAALVAILSGPVGVVVALTAVGVYAYKLHQIQPIQDRVIDSLKEFSRWMAGLATEVRNFELEKLWDRIAKIMGGMSALKSLNFVEGQIQMIGKQKKEHEYLTMRRTEFLAQGGNVKDARSLPGLLGYVSEAGANAKKVAEFNKTEIEMNTAADTIRRKMKQIENEVLYKGKSIQTALQDVRKELSSLSGDRSSITGDFEPAWVLAKEYEAKFLRQLGKGTQTAAKTAKDALKDLVTNIKDSIELLGTPGASFLPGLKEMIKQFPEMSEQWKTLKRLIISLEKDQQALFDESLQRELQNIAEATQAREKQAADEQTAYADYWTRIGAMASVGAITEDAYFQRLKDEFERLLEGSHMNMSQMEHWPKEVMTAYQNLAQVIGTQVTPVMDTLQKQFENDKISKEQYLTAIKALLEQWKEYPFVMAMIERQSKSMIDAFEKTKVTMQSLVDTAQTAMIDKFKELPEHLADAAANAIVLGDSLGDALKKIGQELEVLALKAFLLEGFKMIFGERFHGILDLFKGKGFAQGGVFSGGNEVAFASGGVVNGPTYFPMSQGRTGLMGESGPEAIVPLSKGKDGKLGITASGLGGTYAPNIHINVTNQGSGAMDEEQAQRLGSQLDAMIKVEVAETLYDWKRKGAFRG